MATPEEQLGQMLALLTQNTKEMKEMRSDMQSMKTELLRAASGSLDQGVGGFGVAHASSLGRPSGSGLLQFQGGESQPLDQTDFNGWLRCDLKGSWRNVPEDGHVVASGQGGRPSGQGSRPHLVRQRRCKILQHRGMNWELIPESILKTILNFKLKIL